MADTSYQLKRYGGTLATGIPGSRMRRYANPGTGRLAAPLRCVVARLAEIACPPGPDGTGPDGTGPDRTGRLLAEFEATLSALSVSVRRLVVVALVAFDQGARLYPRARARRFARLDDATAQAYFRAALARAPALALVKGLVVMCYYELPDVQEQIGYRPDDYIALVSQRRLATYSAQILAGQAAVLARDES
jgi:hypothetical protein